MNRNITTEECFFNLLGWKNHFDTNEIPELDEKLTKSLTMEYFNEKHPALRLDYIKQSLPENLELEQYLSDTVKASINNMLNDYSTYRKINGYSNGVLLNDLYIGSSGWLKDVVINESRFVGLSIRISDKIGIKAVINKIGIQFNETQTDLKLYLFHSSKREPLKIYDFTDNKPGNYHFIETDIQAFSNISSLQGGEFFVGYFQDEIVGNAIQYKMDYNSGPCFSCDGGIKQRKFKKIKEYADVFPFYIPSGIDILNDGFDVMDVCYSNSNNFGFNFEITVECDLSYFYCQQKFNFKNLLYLSVVYKVLRDMMFSTEINNIEEHLRIAIIRDLEGDSETNYISLQQQYQNELKAINLDFSGVSEPCLPCKKSNITYGVI